VRWTFTTFAIALVLLVVATPLPATQQAGKVYRIGVMAITSTPSPEFLRIWNAFSDGLREFGYVEGKNIVFERRYSEGRAERFPELAGELVGLKVDLILVVTTPAALAAKAATSTIPILFVTAIDPVGAGLATSLARPGGNVTGLTTLSPELSAKRLELLKELVPRVARVGVLWNTTNPANALVLRQMDEAGRQLGVVLQSYGVRAPDDFESTFAKIVQQRPGALLVLADAMMFRHRDQIAKFALQARLPSIFEAKEMTVAGGLMSYGSSYPELFRRAAFYVDRLLRGVRPADLPFEQPSKFEFVLNMKTARALGLTIPPAMRVRADELIE
jgi:putative ABC transport system substrate-binding protein